MYAWTRRKVLLLLLSSLAVATAAAQTPAAEQTPATSPAQTPAANPDATIVTESTLAPKTPEQLRELAWKMLSDNVAEDKHAETRIQTLAALGIMGGGQRSLGLIRSALDDKNVDIRVAAVLAAGQTRSRDLTSDLRRKLDDKEPAVAFASALTLWKMHDRSGEDILAAVAEGDRKTTPGFVTGTEHTISKQLHDPAGLARYGAMQGAYMLLGPFGIGLTAYEYLHRNGGDSARVSAIEAIAQNHTAPIRTELIAATADKDLGVRAAACKALARYHDADVPPSLAKEFVDPKLPVRLTAAAAYLVSTGAAPGSPVDGEVQPGEHAAPPAHPVKTKRPAVQK